MASAEYCRMRRHRLRLEGIKETTDGIDKYSLNGISWSEPSPNGHHKEENPLEGTIVYQAQMQPGENGRNGNGRKPINISGEIKIPTPVS